MEFYKIYFFLYSVFQISEGNLQDDILKELNNTSAPSLIRKRRYLVFPAGSSFQLVYCLTMPSIGVGQIFTFGATAALAWELPSEPEQVFEIFGKHKTTTTTTTTTTTEHPTLPPLSHDFYDHDIGGDDLKELSHNNRVDSSQQYSRSSLFSSFGTSYHNPFSDFRKSFGGYSPVGNKPRYQQNNYRKVSDYNDIEYNRNKLHPVFHQIHRRTRRSLYSKLENLFTALSKDGKACLLKAICEVSQVQEGKGTFFEEIIKAIFRIKPHKHYPNEDVYDEAANPAHDCNEQYPNCQNSVWEDMF